ncbi:hypothetical protein M4D56_16350 [Cytobacillus oceanisediminis]|uniref:hypothetical protein n=1 Tax=Cytobacillus oceanisediminis TaxID=665099 RepID=UPI002041CBCC|nr:hypothetical protein [Cytobacillus oceanisediminis]MBY0156481.1 hypothetical protein [Cytobacillus firmus]MCM3530653.1 hypothetical protein [Cytobacillus oceanisediminis]
MSEFYIAIDHFDHQIDCFCPDADHVNILHFQKGDLIEVTPERKSTMLGWYALVVINGQQAFYMAIEDIERYFMSECISSQLDIDLKINYLQYKIDQDLEAGDKDSFAENSRKLSETCSLKEELEFYIAKAI